MITPSCYVIDAADWDQAVSAVAWAWVVMTGMVFAATIRWYEVEDRIRRYLRRRRIRAIRAAKAVRL